tara:strand:- start:992 stop:1450 length:459 start_codon:yes stop_codon:yes gene_type:complete
MIALNNSRFQERRAAMPFLCVYHLGIKIGRRMRERRATQGRSVYVDCYANHLMLCVMGILILSACDAVFTLGILANGGEELNWFMDMLIADSVAKFVGVKLALTSLALILLVIHHDVLLTKKIRVRHLKYMILMAYTTLIGYEIFLLQLANA